MGKSIDPMNGGRDLCRSGRSTTRHDRPSLIVSMSFQLAIPGWVALQQSPPPLHQPAPILQGNAFAVQSNSSERRTVLNRLSHPGDNPRKLPLSRDLRLWTRIPLESCSHAHSPPCYPGCSHLRPTFFQKSYQPTTTSPEVGRGPAFHSQVLRRDCR